MDTKIQPKSALDFCKLIDLAECRELIKSVVAELAREHTLLEQAKAHPKQMDKATGKMFDLGKNHGYSTLDLAEARVAYYEAAQDRLWEWYKRLTGGEA